MSIFVFETVTTGALFETGFEAMWLLFVLDGFCSKPPFPVCYKTVLEKHETACSTTWCLSWGVPGLLGICSFVVLPEDGDSGSADVGLCSVIIILKTKMCFYSTSINNTSPLFSFVLKSFYRAVKKVWMACKYNWHLLQGAKLTLAPVVQNVCLKNPEIPS